MLTGNQLREIQVNRRDLPNHRRSALVINSQLRSSAGSRTWVQGRELESHLRTMKADLEASWSDDHLLRVQATALQPCEIVSLPGFTAYLGELNNIIAHKDALGRFEWLGQWVVLMVPTCANPSLVLSERGFLQGRVQVIDRTEIFALCMLVDPQHGERLTDIDALAVRDHTRLPGRSLSIVEFDAIRRGVKPQVLWHCPLRLPCLTWSEPLQRELAIPFIFRTIVPAASALLTRYLSFDSGYVDMPVLRSLSQLPYHVLSDNVISFRAHISKAVTLSFKPVDLFLAMPQVERLHELPLEHHALLSYLELISLSYVVQECEGDELAVPVDKFSQGRESLAFGVAELIGKLQHIIGEIISQRHDELENCVALTDNATLLLMEAKELLGSSNSPIFDFPEPIHAPRVFAELSSQVEQVYRSLRLTTGIGLVSIWKVFIAVPTGGRKEMSNTSVFTYNPHLVSTPRSRRHVFDALSVATLHPMPDTIWDSLQKVLRPGHEGRHEPLALAQHGIDPQHLALELASLSGLTTTPGAACRNLQSVIKIHLLSRSSPMARLIPYQHLIWAFETDARPAETWARAISSWLEGVWHLNLSAEQGMGPEFLHSPIHLSQTVSSGLSRRLPLKSLAVYENEVRARVEAAVLQCHESRPTSGMLDALLSQNVYLVARCFAESFPGDQLEGILSLCGTTGAVPQQLDLLKQSRSDELRSLVQDSFSLQQYDPASPGAAWLSLSNLLFSLVVPNIPIDPARVQNARSMRLREEKIYLDSQIKLHSQLEDFTTAQSVHDELAASPSIEEARDIDRLHQFWAEVTQFSTSVIHPSKVTALANLARINATLALPQEQVIQESVRGFQHRLETLYDDFADIVLPIKLAILQFRLGLRLLLSAKPTSNIEQQFASSIIAFPTPSCVNQVVSQVDEIPSLGLDVSANCLLPLSAIAYDVAGGTDIRERVRELGSLYERLFSLWSIDQARTREAEQQANSLYRQNKTEHLAMTDAELETQEFLELFPQFEGVMESAQHPDSNSPESPLIRPDHTATLAKLHVSFFQSKRQNPEVPAILLWKLRRAALESLLASPSVHLPSELDLLSRQFQLSLLQQSAALLQPRPLSSSNLPNFYTECHVPEVKTLVPLVERMHQRIETLLLEWPDQEVLRHLSGCCQKVLELDLHSPVAKALAEIEQLLLQSEDWEIYANRDNSLKPYRDELISLIVRWRRLELSSWSTLLAAEATKMEDAAGVWWFRLYDLVVRGVLSAVAEVTSGQRSTMDEYLATLIPLVREFITSSPFGEYQVRMQMLVSFAQYLSTLADANNDETKAALDRVSQVLTVLHLHLDSYSAKLSSHLATERSKMEADIKKFIKLASWKDVNIKSHHQLELLKQPFLGDSPIASDIAPVWPTPVAVSSLPPSLEGSSIEHLRNLERTYKRFEAILDQEIRLLVRSSPYALPDELASEIITTSRRLASLTCPAGLEKDKRSKFLKSIQTQKRRAWSDMLKELKRIGFSYNTKADVARDNDSERKPVSDPYFHVLQGCLPSLRLDASRGLAARTIESQESLEALHGIYKRLLSVQDTKLHFHDETAIHHILSLHTFLCAEIPTGLRSALDNFYRLSCHTSNAVKEVGDNITLCSVVCLSQGEMDVLRDASELASKLSGSLTEWAIQYPELSYILHPFSRWLQDELTSGVPLPSPREGREPTGHAADLASLINTFLLSVQSLMPLCSSKKDAGEDEGARITPALEQLRQLGQAARINDIRTRLETVLSQIKSSEALEETLPRLLPFLKAYISLVEDQSSVLALWTKGFCTPPEASDEGDDEAGAENAADGLGLGEGSGAQNVSKEIEDESQVEGLKGDENQDDEKGEAGEEDEQGAIEMNEDFGGDMEDVPDNDDDEGDDDVTLTPALDEKLWGDESGPENKEGNEKADQDHSKQTEGESETVEDDKRGDDGAKEHQEGKEETEAHQRTIEWCPIEEHIPDANTLDLPDDLDLGDENAGEDIDMKEDLEGDDEAVEEDMADPRREMREDEQRSDNTKDEGEGSGESEDHGEEDEVVKNAEEEALAREQQRGGPSDPDAIDADTSGDAGGDGQAGAAQSASGQNMSSERRKAVMGIPTKGEQPAADLTPDPSEGAGATASGLQEGTKPSQSDYTELPNPLRSLGDAMKEIQHRFEEIMNASQDKDPNQPSLPIGKRTSQLEYLHPDMDDQGLQALLQQKINRPHTKYLQPPSSSRAIVQAGAHSLSALPSADDDHAELDQQAELELRKWREAEQPGDQTENIWRLYESLTHDLPMLCDYRTGKRLNMKKDKIWLRRTKPSQREYQSHSIHLAFESLALISKALGRLESGDVAVVKFGGVSHVFGAFRFNQKATNVLSLMETSLGVLEGARERHLWQLEIIISDGMCQDHEKLRTMLRRAEERRIMVVFIILDSLHTHDLSQRSILNMDRAEFKNVEYLDSFPFEYYALPDVLSSTLKQFFERIAEE
ncbi:hypothetical protein BKA70DRAFT_1267626 [Coprinopsis sp. MPI-PUGE-AT-0042]|nr:hypothetical protein BKA70DRAFT_1267626 [Coprinopsis sp. MPI-PUGE-AT-0042]